MPAVKALHISFHLRKKHSKTSLKIQFFTRAVKAHLYSGNQKASTEPEQVSGVS